MTKRFAGFMAIFAFLVACVSGLFTDMEMSEVLLRALGAMAVFFCIGLLVGHIANSILLNSLFGEEANIEEEATDKEMEGKEQGTESPPA